MIDTKLSLDGNCPKCASSDWTPVSDLYEASDQAKGSATSTYAPPVEPPEYWTINNRLINCQRRIDEAPKVRNCLWLLKEKYDDDVKILHACQAYEKEKALWSKTRICNQCGERYAIQEEAQSIKPSFEIPEWPPCI